MPSHEEIAEYLRKLPDDVYCDILARVDAERRSDLAKELPEEPPEVDKRDVVAEWLARRHLATDPGISEVYYLTSGAPQDIRFLEVNRLLQLPTPANGRLSAVDFGLDIEGAAFSLYVIDLTPEQLDAVRQGKLQLPENWSFDPYRRFTRKPA